MRDLCAFVFAWLYVCAVYCAILGYILNIWNFGTTLPVLDTLNIFRGIGMLFPPLGAILGWAA